MATNNNWLRNTAPLSTLTMFENRYVVSSSSVQQIAQYIIQPNVFAALFGDPEKWLSSLIWYPFDVNAGYTADTGKLVWYGDPTSPSIPVENYSLYSLYSLGEFYVPRHFNNFADYDGYTVCRVWLPYYGYVDVSMNEVVGKYMEFLLRMDYRTGEGLYYIAVSDTSISNTYAPRVNEANSPYVGCRIVSTVSCRIGVEFPIGQSGSAERIRNTILGAVKSVASVAGGYAVSQLGSGSGTKETAGTVIDKGRSEQNDRLRIQNKRQVNTTTSVKNYGYGTGSAVNEVFNAAATSLSYMHAQCQIDKPNNSMVLIGSPTSIHVVFYYPKLIESDYGALYGYPLGKSVQLGTLKGYTEVNKVHVEGTAFASATSQEKSMIVGLLMGGIIL